MLLSLDSRRRKEAWRIPIIKTSSYKEQGITELIDSIQQHYTTLVESQQLAQRAQRQVRSELQNLVLQAVTRALNNTITAAEWEQITEAVSSRTRDPYSVAAELEFRIGLRQYGDKDADQ